MAEAIPELPFPASLAELAQHPPVHVALHVVGQHGPKPLLAGRTVTTHLRPEGTILQVRPRFSRPWPLRRGDPVALRFSRSPDRPALEATGIVSWVRDRAFLASGLSVSLVGVAFGWNAEDEALRVAAFLSPVQPH